MTAEPGCYSCASTAAGEAAPQRDRVLVTDHWRVVHAFNTTLPGWLVLLPTVHVESLADLTPEAAAELGPVLRDVTTAMQAALGCEKTYVMLFAEAEGFSHLHFHIVPRMPDQPAELRGPGIFAALGHGPADAIGPAEMDQVAAAIRGQLPGRPRDPGRACSCP